MHGCWGFVGVVSLQRHEDSAYFYFWIGADYQGRGFGRRAARLLFQQAAATGVSHQFASAYASNQRSRAALEDLGFEQMDVAAAAPDDDLVFFHRPGGGSNLAGESRIDRLCELLEAIGSPLSVSRFIQGGRINGQP
ncbi:MAG TPA: GNAT family N-acetyltransferase, partial [Steroidobacteraceae bacterium]